MRRLVLGLVLLVWAAPVWAACSGSGVTWTCAPGTTSGELQNVINDASDGAVVTFQPGAYAWNALAAFSSSKGITLVCLAPGDCVVSLGVTYPVLGFAVVPTGTNTKLYRISGFTFSGGGSIIKFHGPGGTSGMASTLTNVRIDHNTFTGQASAVLIDVYLANVYGVIDNNTVTESVSVMFTRVNGYSAAPARTGTAGTANNLYVEDNVITMSAMTNDGLSYVDSASGSSWVYRYNTVTNGLGASHGVSHGWGPVNIEFYGNRTIMTAGTKPNYYDCYRCFHHQGSGEFIAFDNVFTAYSGKSRDVIAMTHYRSAPLVSDGNPYPATYGRCDGTSPHDGNRPGMLGYPCNRQPGRDAAAVLRPMYVWNNVWSDTGARIPMFVENMGTSTNPSVHDHIAADRDYYNAVSESVQTSASSPFNGTTGMGFGPIALRPTTCTPSAEAGGGVAYWATDEGEWNAGHAGPDGQLYRCSATNTWTLHYVPYQYPHPLRNDTAPTAPANVSVR